MSSSAQCVDEKLICNGQRDCNNGLDEQNCFTWGAWGPWTENTCSMQKCMNANTCDGDCVIIRQRGCFDRNLMAMALAPSPSCGPREVMCGDFCGFSAETREVCPRCNGITTTPSSASPGPVTPTGGPTEKCWTNSYFDCWWIWLIIVLIIIIILIVILCILKYCCTSCWAAACACACLKKNNKSSGNLDTLRRNTLVPDHARPTAAKGTRFEGYDD